MLEPVLVKMVVFSIKRAETGRFSHRDVPEVGSWAKRRHVRDHTIWPCDRICLEKVGVERPTHRLPGRLRDWACSNGVLFFELFLCFFLSLSW